ncbi:MAG: zf-TFIIB domain-containing protein [Bryobacteraceae bacterium]
MNCPSCGAPLHLDPDKDYCQCDYCRSFYFPDQNEEGVRVFGEAAEQSCPVCAVPLVHATINGVRLLYCAGCRGMLISMEIFADMIDELRAQLGVLPKTGTPPDPRDLNRRISCPHCHLQMDTHPYAGPGNVIIDSCSPCTLNWLDHGELMRIVHAPDHSFRPETESV